MGLGRERKAKQDGDGGVRVSWLSYRQIKEIWINSLHEESFVISSTNFPSKCKMRKKQ